MSRMKPATVKRSMTMSTSMHRFEPIHSTKTMNSSSQLPDIVPDRSISPKEMKLNAQNRSDNPNFLKPVENRNLNAEDCRFFINVAPFELPLAIFFNIVDIELKLTPFFYTLFST